MTAHIWHIVERVGEHNGAPLTITWPDAYTTSDAARSAINRALRRPEGSPLPRGFYVRCFRRGAAGLVPLTPAE